jgi:hypothetical protein
VCVYVCVCECSFDFKVFLYIRKHKSISCYD